MKNLPTLLLRKRIVCNQIKYVLLKERNDPFSPQTAEVLQSLRLKSPKEDKQFIDKRTWESWFAGDSLLQPSKVKKFQSILNCEPPLDIWIDIKWLFFANKKNSKELKFLNWLHPTKKSSSLLLHLAALDALGWYQSDHKLGRGSWLTVKKRMSNELMNHLHERWQLDFHNRVGLRDAHPPRVVHMMNDCSFPTDNGEWKRANQSISNKDAAKRISRRFAEDGLMPSEQIQSDVANLYEPLSPISVQNFLFYLPFGLDIIECGAIDEWSLDLITITATHIARLSTLQHHFYVGQNLSETRTLIAGLTGIFWKDDCTDDEFNEHFASVMKFDEIDGREHLPFLLAARNSYRKQLAEFGINHSSVYECWTKFMGKHPVEFHAPQVI